MAPALNPASIASVLGIRLRPVLCIVTDMGALAAARVVPQLNELNRPFWTGGAQGRLMILRDRSTGRLVHPPEALGPASANLVPEAVSGFGFVFSYTVNYQQFRPELKDPYVIAVVELDEQEHLRLPANIVNCDVEDMRIGMRVRVLFEQHGEIFVPLFEPDHPT